jgi:hypothetical protein
VRFGLIHRSAAYVMSSSNNDSNSNDVMTCVIQKTETGYDARIVEFPDCVGSGTTSKRRHVAFVERSAGTSAHTPMLCR